MDTTDVLLVEDDPDDARMVFLGLEEDLGLRLRHVRTGADAVQAVQETPPDVVMVDQRLPDTTGVALIRALRSKGFAGPVVMVSGVRDDRVVARALQAGASDFIVKDLDFGADLVGRLRSLVV